MLENKLYHQKRIKEELLRKGITIGVFSLAVSLAEVMVLYSSLTSEKEIEKNPPSIVIREAEDKSRSRDEEEINTLAIRTGEIREDPKEIETLIKNAIPLDPILEFNRIDHVLVYCANESEKKYVLSELKKRRGLSFRESNGFNQTSYNGAKINIVVQGQVIPAVRGGYDIIQLRGHTGDMKKLYGTAKKLRADHTLVHYGGCNSHQFIKETADENIAVMGGRGTQDGVMNSYILIRLLNVLPNAQDWEHFRKELEDHSRRIRKEQVLPGDREYIRR